MAVAKRQGREKPVKTEQRKVRERPEGRSEGFRQDSLRPSPLHRAGPGEENIQKEETSVPSLSLSRARALFSLRLWIDVPSKKDWPAIF